MFDNRALFDLSDIKAENSMIGKFKDDSNKKVIGVFKPEHVNFNIKEFIGLRSKMYSLLLEKGAEKKTTHDDDEKKSSHDKDDNNEDEVEKKTAKGVVKSVVKKELQHENYRNILESGGKMYSKMKVIRSTKHQLYTMEINKVSLSDDKCW